MRFFHAQAHAERDVPLKRRVGHAAGREKAFPARFRQRKESGAQKTGNLNFRLPVFISDLSGNRTRVYAVRGRRLDRLTNRP